MKINSIKLKNFRQFKNVYLDFSMDSEKPFTIIEGQNTFGKTTLIKAFLWCLYQKNTFQNKNLLNLDVAKSMNPNSEEQTVEVTITLDHNGRNYIIKTSENYYCRPDGTIASKNKNVITKISYIDPETCETINVPITKIESTINDILRPELTDYFFFDGESNKIEKVGNKKNLRDAVSDLMGIKRTEALRDLYNPKTKDGITSVLNSKLKPIDVTKSEELLSKITDLQDQITKDTNNIDNYKSEIEKLEQQKENNEAILESNKDTIALQKKKVGLESYIKNNNLKKMTIFTSMIKTFNSSILEQLFNFDFLKNKFEDKVKNTTFKDENSLSHISEEVIDQLVKRGYCLCGAPIKDKNEAYIHLMEAKNTMEPKNFGKHISDFIEHEINRYNSWKDDFNKVKDKCIELNNLILDTSNKGEELKDIKKSIIDCPNAGEIQSNIDHITKQIGYNEAMINTAKLAIEQNSKKIESLQIEIEQNSTKSAENNLINLCIEYAKNIYSAAENTINSKLAKTNHELTLEVNDIFSRMYHGNRKIVIDNNFNATTEVDGEGDIDTSTGAETVKNYAFVAGLIKLVKNNIMNDDLSDPDETPEDYPLVIDAPFSSTDEIHITNICKVLPECCNQLIFAVMEKDFKQAEPSIEQLIGKKYVIVQHSETDADIKEE